MPGMTGPALGETLKAARPEIHVMLMSGQQDGNLLVLNYGWAFIRKPFVRETGFPSNGPAAAGRAGAFSGIPLLVKWADAGEHCGAR
jgi:hypothetical protein